jgi:hypothetical protein
MRPAGGIIPIFVTHVVSSFVARSFAFVVSNASAFLFPLPTTFFESDLLALFNAVQAPTFVFLSQSLFTFELASLTLLFLPGGKSVIVPLLIPGFV